jgi:hypothetical protein
MYVSDYLEAQGFITNMPDGKGTKDVFDKEEQQDEDEEEGRLSLER